jgi:hypothetical protein
MVPQLFRTSGPWNTMSGDEQPPDQARRVKCLPRSTRSRRTQPVCAIERGGFFCGQNERSDMPNHLTPDELSKEVGIDRDEVIRICVEEHVPIYQGKIDKYLFQTQLEAIRALPQKH